MKNETVVGVLWTLVGVTLVCFFTALVTVRIDDAKWSRIVVPPKPVHGPRFYP